MARVNGIAGALIGLELSAVGRGPAQRAVGKPVFQVLQLGGRTDEGLAAETLCRPDHFAVGQPAPVRGQETGCRAGTKEKEKQGQDAQCKYPRENPDPLEEGIFHRLLLLEKI